MEIKKTLYPKTKRAGSDNEKVVITEKLDGSNLGLFKLNGKLIVAQRNWVFTYPNKNIDYYGLKDWLDENNEHLLENLHEGSGFFGEWIGMGKINYNDTLNKKLYIFAKANINDKLEISNLYYDRDLFIYPFIEQEIPDYIGIVPLVSIMNIYPTIEDLDELYDMYTGLVDRDVEGFIVNDRETIRKYVRLKRGKLTPHEPFPSRK